MVSNTTRSGQTERVRWAARPRRAKSSPAHITRLTQRPLWRDHVASAWVTAVALKESPVTRSGALRGADIPRPKMGNGSRAGSTEMRSECLPPTRESRRRGRVANAMLRSVDNLHYAGCFFSQPSRAMSRLWSRMRHPRSNANPRLGLRESNPISSMMTPVVILLCAITVLN